MIIKKILASLRAVENRLSVFIYDPASKAGGESRDQATVLKIATGGHDWYNACVGRDETRNFERRSRREGRLPKSTRRRSGKSE
jgi:hypothetical protein